MSPYTKHRIVDATDGAVWGCILAWPMLVILSIPDLRPDQLLHLIIVTLWWPLAWSAAAVALAGLRKKMNDKGAAQ